MPSEATRLTVSEVMTLEAFADTIIPGERRYATDRAVAGAADGGGAVAAGAVDLMASEEGGIGGLLPTLVIGLNDHAQAYAEKHDRTLDDSVPAFVALDFDDRTALAAALMAPGTDEQDLWVPLAMFSVMAWDTGASVHTTEALAAGHPGLTTMGFTEPDADGLWRFPDFSYRRVLASPHPHTTPSGDPA
ncbi:regulator [Micromonospora sp. MP36]|nr:regulator [Micromonospora sp. MP36]